MFRIYALIATLPICYVIAKINSRKAMNCLDILLAFHSLYFGIIPLMCNENLIGFKPVVNDGYIQFFAFAYYILFALTLLIFDMYLSKKHSNNLLYLGDYVKKMSDSYNFIGKVAFGVVLISVLLLFFSYVYFMSRTLGTSGMSLDERLRNIVKTQSSSDIFFYGITKTIRTFVTFLISLSFVQAKNNGLRLGKKWKILAFSLFVNYLMNNRTALFEGVVIVAFVAYSVNRKTLQVKALIKTLLLLCLTVGVLFPIISVYRNKSRQMMTKVHSPIDVIAPTVRSVINGEVDVSKADNKDSRSLGVFSIFAKATAYDKSFNGYLTLCSVSHGIPKVLYPSKSSFGSQKIIENTIGDNHDVADSILLNFQLENKFVGFLIANLFFLLLIYIYDKINKIFYLYTNEEYLLIISISLLFPWLNQIESGIEGFVTGLFSAVLLLLISSIVFKCLRYVLSVSERRN